MMDTGKNIGASVPACEILPRCKRGRLRYITCAVLCLFIATSAFAQAEFAKANQEFAQGHFKEAIAGYEALVRSEEHTSELQSHSFISYAVFCLNNYIVPESCHTLQFLQKKKLNAVIFYTC